MGECDIPVDELLEWLDNISFLIPSKITITFSAQRKGKESTSQKKFRNKNGLVDFIKRIDKPMAMDIITMRDSTILEELYRDVVTSRSLSLEIALVYASDGCEETAECFCNYIHNIDKGVHYDGVKQALNQLVIKATRDTLSERDLKKIDITISDVSLGLILAINLLTDAHVQFTSQTKGRLGNPELLKPIKQMALEMIGTFFKNNPKDLKKICDVVKNNAKARIKSLEVRNSVLRGETGNLDEHRISSFIPCSNGRGQYKELFLIEGLSAAGSGRNGRDPKTQALYPLGGVPLNTFDDPTSVVLNNTSLRELVAVLKCNIGDRFDLNKLWYDKIIIMSDEDIDGYKITSLLTAFFLYHMPELVKAGKLYKTMSPLYTVKEKKNGYVKDKREYVKIFEAKINKAVTIMDPKTKKELNSRELEEFLLKNRNYLDELIRTAHHLAVHPQLVEFVTFKRKDKTFKKELTAKFPEIKITDNIVNGIIDGKYQNLLVDGIFDKAVKHLEEQIFTINEGKILYLVKEFDGYLRKDMGTMTVGDILSHCQKYLPEIVTRFKGLATLSPSQLWDTAMNPNTRNLLRLTIDDLEQDLSKFRVIHGTDSTERKNMMEFFRLDRDDIDN
jgi:DNA gyrase subunit B